MRLAFLPLWTLVAITAILPLGTATGLTRQWLARRREARWGHCPSCGYDLRASPGRCPECGNVPTKVET